MALAKLYRVTVDELLCDSVPASRSVFQSEVDRILSDCTHAELKVITETIRTLKENLRELNLRDKGPFS